MTVSLYTFSGNAIYLDTMLPYALLRGIDPAAKTFFERIGQGGLLAYTSALTFDELAYRFVLALIKDHYDGSPLDALRANEEKLLAEFAPRVVAELRRLREFPNLIVLDVLAIDLDTMNDAMTQFHIRPRDALHYAAMKRTGCFDLASNDPHFDRIQALKRYTLTSSSL
jgi:predicted nucleic acid-binding protein